jgi:hypothetical protein
MSNRVLVEGVHIEPFPGMKIARARGHLADLLARVDLWNSARLVRTPMALSEDRYVINFYKPVGDRPPLLEWSVILGEAIHSLRSALDSLVYQLAHLDDQHPPKPTVLAFPVVQQETDWARAVADRLQTTPRDLVERIRIHQPFANPGPVGESHFLQILTDLDNQHKHRVNLRIGPGMGTLAFGDAELRLDNTATQLQSGVKFTYDLDRAPDNEPIARFSFGLPLTLDSRIPEFAHLDYVPSVDVAGSPMEISALSGFLFGNAINMVNEILTGSDTHSTVSPLSEEEVAASPLAMPFNFASGS